MVCLYCYININDINIEGVIFGVFLISFSLVRTIGAIKKLSSPNDLHRGLSYDF